MWTFIEKERLLVAQKPIELFRERHQANTERIAAQVVEFERERREEALQEAFQYTLQANERYLPSHVATFQHRPNFYHMANYLGMRNPDEHFYYAPGIRAGIDIYTATEDLGTDNMVIPVLHAKDDVTPDEMGAIATLMERLTTLASIPRLRIPRGFFVISYRAQWCAGGQEDDPVYRQDIVKANSREEAVQELPGILSGQHENYFRDITLEDRDGSHQVKIKDPMLKGRETDSIVSSPYGYTYSV